jgi:hypothetical protein
MKDIIGTLMGAAFQGGRAASPRIITRMTYTLRYRSSRAEVWRAYWRHWRARLWYVHGIFAVAVAFAMSRTEVLRGDILSWVIGAFVAFMLILVISVTASQLLFKSAERTLEAGPEGWSTQIGKKRGSRKWSELAPVREENGVVIIAGKGGNALLIPGRAFESEGQRKAFMEDVARWGAGPG